ncbi:MAG: diaminopimelate epimerase [Verrucomicrobia bacterium]|nr:diaminopimelate epimerase [Verrucomicrobiota bacterium]
MTVKFSKYQGTGNDFVMIDGRDITVKFSVNEIERICDRRFGIGADGLIILKNHEEADFEMDYYNADGSQSFCGNGSRCAQAFAHALGIIDMNARFVAVDGVHEGKKIETLYATKMRDVLSVQCLGEDYFVDTGSPHYIKYVHELEAYDVKGKGAAIRNSEPYISEGVNVNFVSEIEGKIHVRTYERGVEDETYSCGTGVTAVAIAHLVKNSSNQKEVELMTKGGILRIQLEKKGESHFQNIWLIGPAVEVFSGEFVL